MGEVSLSASPPRDLAEKRRARRRDRFAALRIESLEERLLLHAGHEHDGRDPEIASLLGYFPAAYEQAPVDAGPTALNPLSSIPALDSLPGAADSLYLDFDGFYEASWGDYLNITTPVYDQDGDPTTFSDGELQSIQNIWAQVAEDYAPFKINVTTVLPPSFADGVALRVAIGGDGAWTGGDYGGIAYINNYTSILVTNTVYVFPENLSNGYAKYVAEASSHEAGHAFGLRHQSQYNAAGQKIAEYYAGPGDGRAPIMGNSYNATRGLWWYGTSTSATTFQDDMAVISRPTNTFGYRTDDHGNSNPTSTPLSGSGGVLQATGVIAQTSDVDYFSFTTEAGEVQLAVSVPAGINNLDSRIELRSANGQLITSAAPAGSFGATIVANLAAASYRAVVASQGSYGDVGQYTLTVTVPMAPPASQVVARQLFYNDSAFDGNSAAINTADDSAIATDKSAYLPGDGLAVFENVSSFTRGITGIMIDLAGGGNHAAIGAGDFIFKVGNDNAPAGWASAPAPSAIQVRPGAGAGGSDRVVVTWADAAIANQWLEVQLLATANTGLEAADVHFWGSRIADSGTSTSATVFETAVADAAGVFGNLTGSAAITDPRDYNRSGDVSTADAAAVFSELGTIVRIDIGGAPFAPEEGAEPEGRESWFELALAPVIAAEHAGLDASRSTVAFAMAMANPVAEPVEAVPVAPAPHVETAVGTSAGAVASDAKADDAREQALCDALDDAMEPAEDDVLDLLAAEIRMRLA
jgi:hypothetical protein